MTQGIVPIERNLSCIGPRSAFDALERSEQVVERYSERGGGARQRADVRDAVRSLELEHFVVTESRVLTQVELGPVAETSKREQTLPERAPKSAPLSLRVWALRRQSFVEAEQIVHGDVHRAG